MMNKIAIVVPYFGKLPQLGKLWLESTKRNPKIDFLIFTDIKEITDYNFGDNVKVFLTSFKDFKKKFQKKFDFKISLERPYKLCDFRPAYGLVLSDYLKGYDYWGFGDMDLIWGNLYKFISPILSKNYDRIFDLGHLSLIKNTAKMNNLFLREVSYSDCLSYKYVFKNDFGFFYDETGSKRFGFGQAEICRRFSDVNIYSKRICANVSPDKYNFFLLDLNKDIKYFEYQDGSIFGVDFNKRMTEYPYVHLSRRIFKIDSNINYSHYYIGPNLISSNLSKILIEEKSKKNKFLFDSYIIKRHVKQKKEKIKNNALKYWINVRLKDINI